MAKRKQGGEAIDVEQQAKYHYKAHHNAMKAAGYMMMTFSRPRGTPYVLEEWIGGDRILRIVKATDSGHVTTYVEIRDDGGDA